VQSAAQVRRMGQDPRVALVSFSNFGNPMPERTEAMRGAVRILDEMEASFEYEGEMSVEVALDFDLQKRAYPFTRLSDAANILVMPSLNAASVAPGLMQQLGNGTVIGPLLVGLPRPVQIVPMGSTVSDIVNMAAMAVHDAL
ncbi:MAG: NADP-dependent malic enzyme, partial [Rhodospirillaceae bacterium]|nr:NADP-dependent malic enzyme [Rhodospirillaceae bacterium]